MASTYLPVETILKVDENELLLGENIKVQPVSVSPNYVSIGTQCDCKPELSETKSYNLLSSNEKTESRLEITSPVNILPDNKSDELSMMMKEWPPHSDRSQSPEQNMLVPASFSQQFACNIQSLPVDEKFFLQFDYKTRNKLKTKQRRMDPYYRSQERVRQRAVMRMKRQDPRFRAAEREKGRYRMRLKRLDPVFRSQERERQRERMKVKRSDPGFREREREQQKSRLHVKRLDPAFKEKEDELRMCIKRQNIIPVEMRNSQAAFPENINARLLSLKPKEANLDSFHFKKQQILNFNFYNTTKEHWASHDELCSKTIAHFSITGDNETLKLTSVQSNLDLLRDPSVVPKEIILKSEVHSKTLNIKSEELSLLEAQKQNNSTDQDSSNIPRFSLPSCTEK
ncbi:uncharacterized protein TNIN_123022 [Trichonephila inaurata madagascariensis]|uniref:Uncharacterized protein n=1 Tax=Trichonephila inaurata madagascariensis TaxID=2747483 RepID=A0A8X7CU29_9ARAC|nr:uncharacterized protein TNIN_123022 [Trichonephila inaurata madagascariensis]